jgi:hypothetical protein
MQEGWGMSVDGDGIIQGRYGVLIYVPGSRHYKYGLPRPLCALDAMHPPQPLQRLAITDSASVSLRLGASGRVTGRHWQALAGIVVFFTKRASDKHRLRCRRPRTLAVRWPRWYCVYAGPKGYRPTSLSSHYKYCVEVWRYLYCVGSQSEASPLPPVPLFDESPLRSPEAFGAP